MQRFKHCRDLVMREREDGNYVLYADAQAEIARMTRENENLRQIESNLQDAWEHEHQLAERALAELARLREQMKDREYD